MRGLHAYMSTTGSASPPNRASFHLRPLEAQTPKSNFRILTNKQLNIILELHIWIERKLQKLSF